MLPNQNEGILNHIREFKYIQPSDSRMSVQSSLLKRWQSYKSHRKIKHLVRTHVLKYNRLNKPNYSH